MKSPTSLIRIRYAVGAMLALSAVFAVVLSMLASPQNGALGQGMSNKDKVEMKQMALETAVANPDMYIEEENLADPVAAVAAVEWNDDGDGNTAEVSIVGEVSVKRAAADATPESVTAGTALGGTYLGSHTTVLTNARTAESTELTGSTGSVSANFADLATATVVAGETPTAGYTDALDAQEAKLLTTDETHDIAAYIMELEGIVRMYFGLEDGTAIDGDAATAIGVLYTAGATDNDPGTGNLVELKEARMSEKTALAGARAVLTEVQTALGGITLSDTYSYGSATQADVQAELNKAKMSLSMVLEDDEELTALDELAHLETELKGVGVPSSGVTMARLDAVETALLKNNVDDLTTGNELTALDDDSLSHIIAALMALDDLDGTGAQMAAIEDLDALLTKVDNAVMKTTFTDSMTDDLSNEAMAVSDALSAFNAVKSDLMAKHVDPADVDAAVMALNTIADGDVGSSLNGLIETAASNLSDALNPDDPSSTDLDESALFTALQSSILASDLPASPGENSADDEVTAAELSTALGLTRTDADTATPDDTSDDTLSTDDFAGTLNKLAMLEDAIDMVDTSTSSGVQASNALDALVTAMEATVVDSDTASTGGSLDAAMIAAKALRSNTLAYTDFATMAALQDALDNLDSTSASNIDAKVKVARDALIAAYNNPDGLTSAAQAELETAYQELISQGSTQHAFAQKAALTAVKDALEKDGDDSTALQTAIRNALTTQSPDEQRAQAMIMRIESGIRGATVSSGEKVRLTVEIYGLQDEQDQDLGKDVTFDWSVVPDEGDLPDEEKGNSTIIYTSPSSPGTYTVKASLGLNECYNADADTQKDNCSASFKIKVRRPSAAPDPAPAPQNPPGEIPTILTDGDGNQYEVFTPEGGGTFTGEGYMLSAGAGVVPNGEYIGVRVSDEGSASNVGMTHQRYTLGGNMYKVSAVDATSASITSYALSNAATVCVPLPNELRTDISDLALVVINADGTLTILSAQVRLGSSGTNVCGNLSSLPASVAVGSAGAPAAIPTATPEPTPAAPDTGGVAPNSNSVLWALLLGLAVAAFGTLLVIGRRRQSARK